MKSHGKKTVDGHGPVWCFRVWKKEGHFFRHVGKQYERFDKVQQQGFSFTPPVSNLGMFSVRGLE